MRLEQPRSNVFILTATSQELSALVAAARLTLDAMAGDPNARAVTTDLLRRVLADYDRALGRLSEPDGP